MNQALPFCTYVLFSEKDKMLYTGYTSNIERRIGEHNSGKNKSTALRIPLKLIFCEFYLFEKDARNREQYLKTTAGKKSHQTNAKINTSYFGICRKSNFYFCRRVIRIGFSYLKFLKPLKINSFTGTDPLTFFI